MQKVLRISGRAFALAGVVCLLSGTVLADEQDRQRRIERRVVVRQAPDQYWLGVALGSVGEALKAQLDLEGGVLIQEVMPDSPAEKAGVKPHDILLKFGERDLASVDDLLKSVRQNKDQENTITLLRKGHKRTLTVRPDKRHAEGPAALAVPGEDGERDLGVFIERWLGDREGRRGPFHLRFLGPGVFAREDELELSDLPGDLKISITKQGDEPAKIEVQQNDKTWNVREDDLEELPEEIRAHVKRMLGRDHPTLLRLKALRRGDSDENVFRYEERQGSSRFPHPEQPLPGLDEWQRLRRSFEEMRREFGHDALNELREEIESLRHEIEKLRKSRSDR